MRVIRIVVIILEIELDIDENILLVTENLGTLEVGLGGSVSAGHCNDLACINLRPV